MMQRKTHALKDVLRWLIRVLVKMAQEKAYGEVRIVVQDGQIEFVHESRSYRDRLPVGGPDHVDQVLQDMGAT